MPVQLNIFLLLFGGLQGLLLSLFLARKKTYRSGYIFLIVYILVMLLQILMKVVSKAWLMENLDILYGLSYRLPFLYGPLAYLLVFYLLSHDRRFALKDLVHFAPFILAVIVMIDYTQTRRITFLTEVFLNPLNSLVLQLVSIVTYHFLALRLWWTYNQSAKNFLSDLGRLQFQWVRGFNIFSSVVCVVVALAVYFMYVYYPHWSNARYLFVALTIFIYWISYTALSQPAVFIRIDYRQARQETPVQPLVPKRVVDR